MCVLLILMGVFPSFSYQKILVITHQQPTEGLFKVWFIIIEIRNEKKIRHNQMFETESFIYHKLSRKEIRRGKKQLHTYTRRT